MSKPKGLALGPSLIRVHSLSDLLIRFATLPKLWSGCSGQSHSSWQMPPPRTRISQKKKGAMAMINAKRVFNRQCSFHTLNEIEVSSRRNSPGRGHRSLFWLVTLFTLLCPLMVRAQELGHTQRHCDRFKWCGDSPRIHHDSAQWRERNLTGGGDGCVRLLHRY